MQCRHLILDTLEASRQWSEHFYQINSKSKCEFSRKSRKSSALYQMWFHCTLFCHTETVYENGYILFFSEGFFINLVKRRSFKGGDIVAVWLTAADTKTISQYCGSAANIILSTYGPTQQWGQCTELKYHWVLWWILHHTEIHLYLVAKWNFKSSVHFHTDLIGMRHHLTVWHSDVFKLSFQLALAVCWQIHSKQRGALK